MDELLRELLDGLDLVAKDHEEIYDTVCRDKMGDCIFHLFIKPQEHHCVPDDFGLFSDEANRQVKQALCRYIDGANEHARNQGMTEFHWRLAAFQNESVRSTIERNYFDDFFGWSNPTDFDQQGNIKRNH